MAQCCPVNLEQLANVNYSPPQSSEAAIPLDHAPNDLHWHQMCAIGSSLQHFFHQSPQTPQWEKH